MRRKSEKALGAAEPPPNLINLGFFCCELGVER
jgi:hypothetical protein